MDCSDVPHGCILCYIPSPLDLYRVITPRASLIHSASAPIETPIIPNSSRGSFGIQKELVHLANILHLNLFSASQLC
jgi:hypothetical protein